MSLHGGLTPRSMSCAELADRLRDRCPPQVWNVLTDDAFDGRLIPGSVRVPFDLVVRSARAATLPSEAEIVVYGSGPCCPLSALAAAKLAAAGYGEVAVFDGGLAVWDAAGRPFAAAEVGMAPTAVGAILSARVC